ERADRADARTQMRAEECHFAPAAAKKGNDFGRHGSPLRYRSQDNNLSLGPDAVQRPSAAPRASARSARSAFAVPIVPMHADRPSRTEEIVGYNGLVIPT